MCQSVSISNGDFLCAQCGTWVPAGVTHCCPRTVVTYASTCMTCVFALQCRNASRPVCFGEVDQ